MLEKKSKHIPIRRGAFVAKNTTRYEDHQYISEIVYKMIMLMSPSYDNQLSEQVFDKKKIDIIRLEIKDALLGEYNMSVFDEIDTQNSSMKDASYLIYAAFSYTESRHRGVQYCQGLIKEEKISKSYGESLIKYLMSHNKIVSKHPQKSLLPIGAVVMQRDMKNVGMYLEKHRDLDVLEVKIVEKTDDQFMVISSATQKIGIEQFLEQGAVILPGDNIDFCKKLNHKSEDSQLKYIMNVGEKELAHKPRHASCGKTLVINNEEDLQDTQESEQKKLSLDQSKEVKKMTEKEEKELEEAAMKTLTQCLMENPQQGCHQELEKLTKLAEEERLEEITKERCEKVKQLKHPEAFRIDPTDLNMLRASMSSNVKQKTQLVLKKVKVKVMYHSLTSSEKIFEAQETARVRRAMNHKIRLQIFSNIWKLSAGNKIICGIS